MGTTAATETSPMPFTPHTVIEHATPDPNEVLVVGFDDRGIPQNVLLRNAPELKAQLVATPPVLPNPDHVAVTAELDAATSQAAAIAAQLETTPPTVDDQPNPDHAALSEQLATAQTTVASLAAQAETIPPVVANPERAAIEQTVFAAAIAEATPASEPASDGPVDPHVQS